MDKGPEKQEENTSREKMHNADSSNFVCLFLLFFFAVALRPNAGHGLLILEVSRSHTTTHHSR
jgi:hypothetical protein